MKYSVIAQDLTGNTIFNNEEIVFKIIIKENDKKDFLENFKYTELLNQVSSSLRSNDLIFFSNFFNIVGINKALDLQVYKSKEGDYFLWIKTVI